METTFLKNCWYVAGWASDLVAGAMLPITIINQPVVVYRTAGGNLVALEDRCRHRAAPLSAGRLEGDNLRCMYHGMMFSPSGKCVEIPGETRIPEKFGVKSYPVVDRNNWIWVWMGATEAADPGLIPDARYNDDPDMEVRTGQIDYAANYMLINDNLLDLSHLAFVHGASFGGTASWATERPKVEQLERGLRVERFLLNQRQFPFLPDKGPIDIHNVYDYLVPGVFIMIGRNFTAGTAADCNFRDLDESRLQNVGVTCQAVTPMTANTTRYFFSTGTPKRENHDGLADRRMDIARKAFGEDRAVIEAQQRVINLDPDRRLNAMSGDEGLTKFRLLVDRLIRAEAQAATA